MIADVVKEAYAVKVMTSLEAITLLNALIDQNILNKLPETTTERGERMELEKLQGYAKAASKKELKALEKLEDYYKDECSLGFASEQARIPLRALMDFMQKKI